MSTAAAPAALRLLQLEAEIRRLEDETALLHHLANTLAPLVPHAQAWVLRESGRVGSRSQLRRELFLQADEARHAFEKARDAELHRGFQILSHGD